MTCSTCGGELVPGANRCPVCDASVGPRVEGALATDPRLVTPPSRGKVRADSSRDIPGLRKREKTWRDEVQERVRTRRQKRQDAGLPLFDQPEAEPPPAAPPVPSAVGIEVAVAERPSPRPVAIAAAEGRSALPASEPDLASTRLSEAELADLPLRAPSAGELESLDREVTELARSRRVVPSLDEDSLAGDADLEAELELPPPVAEATPVERPARAAERAQAAAFDAAIFAALSALVVYFTGRAARADLRTLASSWPGLALYLGLLALFYAGYFTGTTGQTPGKLMTGLRVVVASGRPPGYFRAMARAFVGLLGTGLVGLGLAPIAFDPAARALHDRLFRTRVVRN
jgi:uncharacterized RDD family membrane protein YckC